MSFLSGCEARPWQSAYGDDVNEIKESLVKGAEEALSWFKSNSMSANADKFQAIFAKKD